MDGGGPEVSARRGARRTSGRPRPRSRTGLAGRRWARTGRCGAGTFDGRRGWVNRLATRPGQRRHGWATALLGELERRFAAKGCRKVNLLIEPDNQPVTSFYEQNGYSSDQLIFMEKWLPA